MGEDQSLDHLQSIRNYLVSLRRRRAAEIVAWFPNGPDGTIDGIVESLKRAQASIEVLDQAIADERAIAQADRDAAIAVAD